MLRHVRIRPGDEDPEAGELRAARPDLLAVDDPLVAVAHRPGAEPGQVRPGPRLAEQLAPELLAGEHRRQVALLLLRRAGEQDGRPGPADADRVDSKDQPSQQRQHQGDLLRSDEPLPKARVPVVNLDDIEGIADILIRHAAPIDAVLAPAGPG